RCSPTRLPAGQLRCPCMQCARTGGPGPVIREYGDLMAAQHARLNLLNLSEPRIRLLHLSWMAFFVSFVVWFSHAPLLGDIREVFDLTGDQIKALLILNVALTIPARVVIGSLVDRFGPRRVFGCLLIIAALPCWAFALASTYEQLAVTRLLLGFVGAGFVVGIRLISEWFPAREVGLAEGVYGGWGNFGSAAAAMT